MSDREFLFCGTEHCELCGKQGAWDVYGDFICSQCIEEAQERERKRKVEESKSGT